MQLVDRFMQLWYHKYIVYMQRAVCRKKIRRKEEENDGCEKSV